PAAAAEPSWFTLPEPNDDDAPASEDKLPDWLSGLSATEEPAESAAAAEPSWFTLPEPSDDDAPASED
ncbi:MAG: hypothetical protein KA338_25710, partial [Chloroflexi bacterium]|nr:hypothetical protein [Chloroflexota bacterium]